MTRKSARAGFLLLVAAVAVSTVLSVGCKLRREREAEQAHLDSLYRDSTNKFNPYKIGQGTDQYNRQREALGDINKLTTPPQPDVPVRK